MTDYYSFDPAEGHGLPGSPFKAFIAPRPIGWISTYTKDGVANLAPYSFFQALSDKPPIIAFVSDHWKHSIQNAQDTGCFVHNVVAAKMKKQMVATSEEFAADESEFEHAGLKAVPATSINAPMVDGAVAQMECRVVGIQTIKDMNGNETNSHMVMGQVVRIHFDKAYLTEEGRVDSNAMSLVSRLGYWDYADANDVYHMHRPRR